MVGEANQAPIQMADSEGAMGYFEEENFIRQIASEVLRLDAH